MGDDLPYDLGGGGSVDIEVGKVLLEQIRPTNPGDLIRQNEKESEVNCENQKYKSRSQKYPWPQ